MSGTSDPSPSSSGVSRGETRRIQSSSARLAAVQALYALDVEEDQGSSERPDSGRVESIVRAFMDGSLGSVAMLDVPDPMGLFDPTEERTELAPPDGELFCQLVRGTAHDLKRVDDVVKSALSNDWPWDRLEALLRAILRVAVFELMERPKTPVRVVIKEYVDLTASFYSGPERGMVNAVLDRLARVLRPEAFDPVPDSG